MKAAVQAGESHLSTASDTSVLRVWHSKLALSARASVACESPEVMHQLVTRGWGDSPIRESDQRSVLYAAERSPTDAERGCGLTGRPSGLLVQSGEEPDWRGLIRDGVLASAHPERVEQVWRRGERAELRVSASPLVSRNGTNGKLARRELLRTREECRTWFCTHLKRAGCTPILASIEVADAERTRAHGRTITFRSFRATVKISDPERFHALLVSGMGRNRAWGAGLVLAR
ncbi:type I-E CRISPR-associated protein Cas6/Cse3/CasE [Streptomyces sp. NPDC006283]|uniref:type I-E CRISPR-associated protein Cas6/Cse3/CasE n=1 Tax=Streptomyces sp. NPDC006283 TaxID=3156741 RepID=UPI0033B5B995